jgi:hypothetical protein
MAVLIVGLRLGCHIMRGQVARRRISMTVIPSVQGLELQQAVFEWRRVQKDIDNDFKRETSEHGAETESIKVGMSGS